MKHQLIYLLWWLLPLLSFLQQRYFSYAALRYEFGDQLNINYCRSYMFTAATCLIISITSDDPFPGELSTTFDLIPITHALGFWFFTALFFVKLSEYPAPKK